MVPTNVAFFWLPNLTLLVNMVPLGSGEKLRAWIKYNTLIRAANVSLWCKPDWLTNALPTLGFIIIHMTYPGNEAFPLSKFSSIIMPS